MIQIWDALDCKVHAFMVAADRFEHTFHLLVPLANMLKKTEDLTVKEDMTTFQAKTPVCNTSVLFVCIIEARKVSRLTAELQLGSQLGNQYALKINFCRNGEYTGDRC